MGSKRQKQRRLAMKAQAQKHQQTLKATNSSTPSSAYNIVGNITPESFDMPSRTICSAASGIAPEKIDDQEITTEDVVTPIPSIGLGGFAPEPSSTALEDIMKIHDASGAPSAAGTSEDQKYSQGNEENATHLPPFQSLAGFDATLGFEAITSSREGTKSPKLWNTPTTTSYRRIKAIFEKPSSTLVTTLSNSAAEKDKAPDRETILDRLAPTSHEQVQLQRPLMMLNHTTFSPSLPPAGSTASMTVPSLKGDIHRLLTHCQPLDMFTSVVMTWARSEAVRLYKSEMKLHPSDAAVLDGSEIDSMPICSIQSDQGDQALHMKQEMAQYPPKEWALVSYQTFRPCYPMPVTQDDFCKEGDTVPSLDRIWSLGRVFLVALDGVISYADSNQQLYDVRLIDETASDFDSVASPVKIHPHVVTGTDKSDQSNAHQDLEDLECLEGHMMAAEHCEFDVQDLGMDESLEAFDHHHLFRDFSSFGDIHENDQPEAQEHASESELSPSPTKDPKEQLGESYIGEEFVEDGAEDVQDEINDPPRLETQEASEFEIRSVALPVEPYDADNASQATTTVGDAALYNEKSHKASRDASDWASELVRTMLGTESLFTCLSILRVEANGNASKSAIVTAFLKLVNFERQKLGEVLLPSSCTALTMLASRILPHTTLLGTTSLAALLSELHFDAQGEATVIDLHNAFTKLSKTELRIHCIATTGVMGDLGRALGKLA